VCGADVGCPACYTPKDPYLIATCDTGQCKVLDLKTHPSTVCSSANDCRIRTNVCCECGGPTDAEHLIAMSSEPAFTPLVCDPNQGCDDCAPGYPSLSVSCQQGHCSVDALSP
jgi:hypothetical protein